MQDSQLNITNAESFLETLEMAAETESLDSLLLKLKRLEQWYSDKPITINLWAKGVDELEFSLFAGDTRLLVGGIIYHKTSNLWGMHT